MTGRLLIAAPFSGTGKTTAVMALLAALARRGVTAQPFKSGPDFIDPRLHELAMSRRSHNLDIWLLGADAVRALVARSCQDADLGIIEGAMGLYDGLGSTDRLSAAQLARETETPVVLLVPSRGISRSAAALVKGFVSFWNPPVVRGIIFTRTGGPSHAELLKKACSDYGVPALGYLPELPDCRLKDGQLGLVCPDASASRALIGRLAEAAQECIDWPALLSVAQTARPLAEAGPAFRPSPVPLRIGLARDEAFDADYPAALTELERAGVSWVPFSPMNDARLPDDLNGLWIRGGGTFDPISKVSANRSLAADLSSRVRAGLPLWAEGLGAACLAENARTDGRLLPLWGVLPGTVYRTDRRAGFGYVTLEMDGRTVPAHEYRYWEWEEPQANVWAVKASNGSRWPGGFVREGLVALFGHTHPLGASLMVEDFLRTCAAFR